MLTYVLHPLSIPAPSPLHPLSIPPSPLPSLHPSNIPNLQADASNIEEVFDDAKLITAIQNDLFHVGFKAQVYRDGERERERMKRGAGGREGGRKEGVARI